VKIFGPSVGVAFWTMLIMGVHALFLDVSEEDILENWEALEQNNTSV